MTTDTANKYITLDVLTPSPALAMNVREEYPDLDVRVGFDLDNEPWFVLKDYCYSVGLTINGAVLDLVAPDCLALVNMEEEGKEMAYMFAKNFTFVYFINRRGVTILINELMQQQNDKISADIFGDTKEESFSSQGISLSNKPSTATASEEFEMWETSGPSLRNKDGQVVNQAFDFSPPDPKQGNIHFEQSTIESTTPTVRPGDEVTIKIGHVDDEGLYLSK